MSTFDRIHQLVQRIELRWRPDYYLETGEDDHGVFVQVCKHRPDANTGEVAVGRGGKRYLRPDQTDGQIVRVVFGALLAYEEHEWREAFHFDGHRIFGPHIRLDALVQIADQVE